MSGDLLPITEATSRYRWEAYCVHGNHYPPVPCLDEASARATAARLSSQVFPWRARPIVDGDA
jgi:hypothetical protein